MAKRKLNKVKLVKANARERVGQPKRTQVRVNKKRNYVPRTPVTGEIHPGHRWADDGTIGSYDYQWND